MIRRPLRWQAYLFRESHAGCMVCLDTFYEVTGRKTKQLPHLPAGTGQVLSKYDKFYALIATIALTLATKGASLFLVLKK